MRAHAGDIWEGVYSEECFFGDPTVSFTGALLFLKQHKCKYSVDDIFNMQLWTMPFAGLQKWRRNLQLLVPFLEDPQIELFSLGVVGSREEQAAVRLKVSDLPFVISLI